MNLKVLWRLLIVILTLPMLILCFVTLYYPELNYDRLTLFLTVFFCSFWTCNFIWLINALFTGKLFDDCEGD